MSLAFIALLQGIPQFCQYNKAVNEKHNGSVEFAQKKSYEPFRYVTWLELAPNLDCSVVGSKVNLRSSGKVLQCNFEKNLSICSEDLGIKMLHNRITSEERAQRN